MSIHFEHYSCNRFASLKSWLVFYLWPWHTQSHEVCNLATSSVKIIVWVQKKLEYFWDDIYMLDAKCMTKSLECLFSSTTIYIYMPNILNMIWKKERCTSPNCTHTMSKTNLYPLLGGLRLRILSWMPQMVAPTWNLSLSSVKLEKNTHMHPTKSHIGILNSRAT